MAGGTNKDGTPVYRRVNGIYERTDRKAINHRKFTVESNMVITPTARAAMSPLPRTGRQVSPFLEKTLAIADLNNNNNSDGNKISRSKRKLKDMVARIMNGTITTDNGGFVLNEHEKNTYFLKYNDLPDFDTVLNEIRPQLTPANLREIISSGINATIDGKVENSNLFVFQVNVTDNHGQTIPTYVKVHPFHGPDGKPYTALVSIHKPKGGSVTDKTTPAQKG